MQDFRTFQIRFPGHPKYQDDVVVVDDPIIHILQKMELLIFTNKGDLIADMNFGCNLEELIWQTGVSGEYIQSIVTEQFNTYIPELNQTDWSISVDFFEYDSQYIAIINIVVNGIEITAIFS